MERPPSIVIKQPFKIISKTKVFEFVQMLNYHKFYVKSIVNL